MQSEIKKKKYFLQDEKLFKKLNWYNSRSSLQMLKGLFYFIFFQLIFDYKRLFYFFIIKKMHYNINFFYRKSRRVSLVI